jgi:DNA-binding transcriptional ArsR family regulator
VGLSPSAVSNQLAPLRRAGVVSRRRAGKQVFYRGTSPLALELLREVKEG